MLAVVCSSRAPRLAAASRCSRPTDSTGVLGTRRYPREGVPRNRAAELEVVGTDRAGHEVFVMAGLAW